MSGLLQVTIEQGLIFSVLSIGVYITYKILDFPDLSVEGTFPLGAFVFAKFILLGASPGTATLMALLAGAAGGLVTYTLNIRFRIKAILAGILTMTLLYSVNLRINGKSNIGLSSFETIFDSFGKMTVLIVVVFAVKLLMDRFLKSETGYLLIATGDNETLVKSLGQNSDRYKMMGLMISNALVALSGALMAQSQGFVDITMGNSIIVVALASIIIGDTVMQRSSILKGTTRAIIGAVAYKMIGGLAIEMGLAPTDLKAISAFIVIAFLAYNNMKTSKLKSAA
ncbi:MAG: ABC transporter permease [Proteocatella sp.]|nr:ABC transporter permease [Proteocatella sp.]MBP7907920.1 ABC transporter permease [Proteocatella sp.]MBP7912996.1 ABC transporter permease [Proteocatella sp.]MBP8654573.1 ABC transporter permease [Proteocatella sp.]MBP9659230.1 ABC transporter permease [Proteocatella sp.]